MSVRRDDTSHMKLLMAAFEAGRELDVFEAAEVAFLSVKEARRYLFYLKDVKKVIHIDRWNRRATGPRFPVFVIGQGQDAERPKWSRAEKARAFRLRKRVPKPDLLLRAFMNPTGGKD
jgi:hypothetical protein